MCIFLSVLCSLSCLLLLLSTTRDLAFRDRTSGLLSRCFSNRFHCGLNLQHPFLSVVIVQLHWQRLIARCTMGSLDT